MSQHILKKPVLDLGAVEGEFKQRMRLAKTKLLLSHIFCFLLAVTIIFFVI
jgi:hypothetical protein